MNHREIKKMRPMTFNKSFEINHRYQYQLILWTLTFAQVIFIGACSSLKATSALDQKKAIEATQEANIDHVVPKSFQEAEKVEKNGPMNLGVYSPLGTSTSMTSNNTSTQSTQNTPALAIPFVVLQSAVVDNTPKNGIPVNIAKLTKEKNWTEALKAIDLETKKNPRNVQLLFIQSRIYIELGQLENARIALTNFIEKYPDIPEPYNNLAVLYASAGKLDIARENLEMSIKLAPNYAIALQNLGDIYTLTAASYYDKAYQQDRRLKDADKKRKLAQAITTNQ
jgi:tetratricopeptide (TPR) repeat protein